MSQFRRRVKAIRSVPSVNRLVTGGMRAATDGLRWGSEYLELHGVRETPFTCALPNGTHVRLFAEPGNAVLNLLWWQGWDGYEAASVHPWVDLASTARTVVDVGANVGVFSLLAAASGAQLVVAFEPRSTTYAALRRSAELNAELNVLCVRAALCDRPGEVTLLFDESEPFDAMASMRPGTSGTRRVAEELCPGTTLDDFCQERDLFHIDLVKIDVEGAEPEVLAGMAKILRRDRPDLVIEVLDERAARAVSAIAAEHGYLHCLLTRDGPVPTELVAPNARCLNHLLTKRTAADALRLGMGALQTTGVLRP